MKKQLLSSYEIALNRYCKEEKVEKKTKEKPKRISEYKVANSSDLLKSFESPEDFLDSVDSGSLLNNEEQQVFYEINKMIKKETGEKIQKMKKINKKMENIEAHWYGHFTSYTGFSKMNREMVFGLSNKGVKIKTDIQESNIEVNESTYKELQLLSNTKIKDESPKVFGATIPLRLFHGGKKILYTMMETSQTLHKGYVERINLYNEIWVPTYEAKEMFKNNGVRPNIEVMPLGVDIDLYKPDVKALTSSIKLKDFVFISVFKWGYRKGFDILLRAYLDEFSSSDDVSLLLVSRTDVNHKQEIIQKDFKDIRNLISKQDLPHVALYDKPIKEYKLPSFYKLGDCFILMSRGEGFGLPLYEAGAMGIPVISTNCSAQKELLDNKNSYLVDPEKYVKANVNGELSKLAKHCGFYNDQMFPYFGKQSIEKTKEHMRDVYENYEDAKIKSQKLMKKVRENYSWDNSINKVYNRLKAFQIGD